MDWLGRVVKLTSGVGGGAGLVAGLKAHAKQDINGLDAILDKLLRVGGGSHDGASVAAARVENETDVDVACECQLDAEAAIATRGGGRS